MSIPETTTKDDVDSCGFDAEAMTWTQIAVEEMDKLVAEYEEELACDDDVKHQVAKSNEDVDKATLPKEISFTEWIFAGDDRKWLPVERIVVDTDTVDELPSSSTIPTFGSKLAPEFW